ncbi:hypothetical protein QCA50_015730 [Cerrena zonata]|uniref:Uncharacterized protein n=1 Tax=Cerrena zonata TaxID=2478898 RepID=A0AAW0FWP8_9APHY
MFFLPLVSEICLKVVKTGLKTLSLTVASASLVSGAISKDLTTFLPSSSSKSESESAAPFLKEDFKK